MAPFLLSRPPFRPPLAHLGSDFAALVAPTWAAGPSKVVILLQRGVKITKSAILTKFAQKIAQSPSKSRANEPGVASQAPTRLPMVLPRGAKGSQNRPKIDKILARWPPRRHLCKKCPQIGKQKRRKASKPTFVQRKALKTKAG